MPRSSFEALRQPPLFLLVAGLGACTGVVEVPAGSTEAPRAEAPAPSGSRPAPSPEPPASPEPCSPELVEPRLRRLTAPQYRRTVEAAFGEIFDASDFPRFDDAIPTIGLGSDPNNLRVDTLVLERLHEGAESLSARVLAQHPETRVCLDGGGAACLHGLVPWLARRLWRRPLESEELDDLRGGVDAVIAAGGNASDAARFLVEALLLAPSTLYRRELGADAGRLDPYELASALSYTLWDAPPDARLLELAASGALAEPSTLTAEARRLAQDPRFASAMVEFFFDFLKVSALPGKEKIPELGLTPEVRAELAASLREDLRALLARPRATLFSPLDLTTFRVSPSTAEYFGVAPGQGRSLRDLPPGERHGILTHPAFLAVHSGAGDSGIVKRGVFTLEQLLCQQLGAPPDDISPVDRPPPDFDPERASSRERLHVLHSSQPTCQGCHQFIDPAGYGFENYDAAGRWRTSERGDIPIDASGTLRVEGEALSFQDGVDYARALGGSKTLRRCFVETFLTHALGGEAGHCERETFADAALARGAELTALAELLVKTPSFIARAAPEDDE